MAKREQKRGKEDGRDAKVHNLWPFLLADVQESTVITVERRGQFRKSIIEWEGRDLDKNWNVIDLPPGVVKKKGFFGGLHIVGIQGLDKVKEFDLRWKTSQLADGPGKIEFYDRTLNSVMVKVGVYYTEVIDAETSPSIVTGTLKQTPERIPLRLELLVTARVVNVRKILYDAPKNWVEKAMDLINSLATNQIGTMTYDQVLLLRDPKKPLAFWDLIKGDPLFNDTFERVWGWMVENIRIKSITPPDEIQKAGMMEKEMEMKARADVVKTAGRWLKMMSSQIGLTEDQIQAEINKNPVAFQEKYGKVSDQCWDIIVRELGIAGKAYLDIRTIASEPGKTLLDAIAALMRIPKGGGGGKEDSGESSKGGGEYLSKSEAIELSNKRRKERE